MFAADSYGNQIDSITTYEKIAGTWSNVGEVTNDTYSEPFNISMSDEPVYFGVQTLLNETLASYSNVSSTLAVGVTLEGTTTSEAGPLSPVFPIGAASDGFWTVPFISDTYDIDLGETEVTANFTLWIDYERNGTWTNTEYWILNLQWPEEEEYVPVTVNELDFSFVWFWATVGSLSITAISGGIAIRKVSVPYFMIALFSGMFTYAFYQIMAVGG